MIIYTCTYGIYYTHIQVNPVAMFVVLLSLIKRLYIVMHVLYVATNNTQGKAKQNKATQNTITLAYFPTVVYQIAFS